MSEIEPFQLGYGGHLSQASEQLPSLLTCQTVVREVELLQTWLLRQADDQLNEHEAVLPPYLIVTQVQQGKRVIGASC